MWQREERLGHRLGDSTPSERPDFAQWLEEKLSWRSGLWHFPNCVREQSLCLHTRVISLDDSLAATADVQNGLGVLDRWAPDMAGKAQTIDRSGCMTRYVDLLGRATVRTLNLPSGQQARIRQGKLIPDPKSQWLKMDFGTAGVNSLKLLRSQQSEVRCGDRLLRINAGIRTRMRDISTLPFMRISQNVDELPDTERKGFLREAEVFKCIPADRSELLAVFRHVPIEMISRLRYVAEKKLILFSISREPKRTRTRVHDMAAVRDTATQEIHLVPHRTRFRAVSIGF